MNTRFKSFTSAFLVAASILSISMVPVLALATPAWTAFGTIASFQDGGNGVEVTITGDSTNPGGCALAGTNPIVPLPSLTAEQRERYSRTLLAAHLAGRPVAVRVTDTCSAGTTATPAAGYRMYYAVRMQ